MHHKKRWKISPEEIIEFVGKKEEVNPSSLSNHFDVNYNSARKYLEALAEEGKLKENVVETPKLTYRTYVIQ